MLPKHLLRSWALSRNTDARRRRAEVTCPVDSSFMQHPRAPESLERGFTPEQAGDLERRNVSDILAAAEKRNLLEGDARQYKLGGLCRDFAIVAVSRFREHGIPARLRVGFADYLVPGCWEDHWLCEWRDGTRWKRLDVEFAAVDGISFDALMCGRALSDSKRGVVPDQRRAGDRLALWRIEPRPCGAWFVAGSLFRRWQPCANWN